MCDDDDDDCRFEKRITQDASTVLFDGHTTPSAIGVSQRLDHTPVELITFQTTTM